MNDNRATTSNDESLGKLPKLSKAAREGVRRATENAVKAMAEFREENRNFVMEVDTEDDGEFQSDNKSHVITFNEAVQGPAEVQGDETEENDTASEHESEGEVHSDDEIFDEQQEVNQPAQNVQVNINREEIIDAAVAKFQDVFMSSGIMETMSLVKKQLKTDEEKNKHRQGKGGKCRSKSIDKKERGEFLTNLSRPTDHNLSKLNKLMSQASTAELTIYRNAMESQINKRTSSSSEDEIDQLENKGHSSDLEQSEVEISDESQEVVQSHNNPFIDEFVADARERTS